MMPTKNTQEVAGVVLRNTAQYKGRIDDAGRECSKCETYKVWEEYGRYTRSPLGRRAVCRSCMGAVPKRDRAASNKRWRDNLKANDPLKLKARTVKAGMRKRSKLPAPTANEIEAWLKTQTMVCHYTGAVLPENDFSVDHRTPLERGGTNDVANLCLCTKEINTTKGTMTDPEFKALLALVKGWDDDGRMLARLRMAGHAFGK